MKTLAIVLLAGSVLASAATAQDLPAVQMDQALHDRLPQEIRDAGYMISVNNGSFPPYEIVEGNTMTGASADLTHALGDLLGVEIRHETVGGLPALLTG